MNKVGKLNSVLKMLKDEAKKANKEASEHVGVNNNANCYFQGLRDGYLQAAKLLKEKSNQLA